MQRNSVTLPRSRFLSATGTATEWNFPRSSSVSAPPPTYSNRSPLSQHNEDDASRRSSDASSRTLVNNIPSPNVSTTRVDQSQLSSLSSRNHPANIQSPNAAYDGQLQSPTSYSDYGKQVDEEQEGGESTGFGLDQIILSTCQLSNRRRGYLSNLIDLYRLDEDDEDLDDLGKRDSLYDATRRVSRVVDPLAYDPESQILDRDDPIVTGVRKKGPDDIDEIEKGALQKLSYKERRKEQQRIRIRFNLCCEYGDFISKLTIAAKPSCSAIEVRQAFLMTIARALLAFGAPSHRIESQLLSAARILEVDAEFTHMPGIIIASFGDEGTKTSSMHFAKCGGRLSLGNLHHLHRIYRAVVHDELSAKKATDELKQMMESGPMNKTPIRLLLSFLIAFLICPIAFGGSFIDMFLAGAGSLFLACVQTYVASGRSVIYANVYE